MNFVVDTNVGIFANGRDTHASNECMLACIEFILGLKNNAKHHIFMDRMELIFNEYKSYFNFSGNPGTGDAFFQFIFDNMHSNKKVRLVDIHPIADEERSFEELPANSLDKDDRKFLAVAVISKSAIANAADPDWIENISLLKSLDVKLRNIP